MIINDVFLALAWDAFGQKSVCHFYVKKILIFRLITSSTLICKSITGMLWCFMVLVFSGTNAILNRKTILSILMYKEVLSIISVQDK